MTTRAQFILMRLLTILALLAVVAVMTAAAWTGEMWWGFR